MEQKPLTSLFKTARAIVYKRALLSVGHFKIKDQMLVYYSCRCRAVSLPNGLPKTALAVPVQYWIKGYEKELLQELGEGPSQQKPPNPN